MTTLSTPSAIDNLVEGQTMLAFARLSKNGEKAYCTFASVIKRDDSSVNMLGLLNKGDDRFNSKPKPRRAWASVEPTIFEQITGKKFSELTLEDTEINLLNPTVEGHEISLCVRETLDANEEELSNVEKYAKQTVNRKTGEILYFYKDGKHIFSNMVIQAKGSAQDKHIRINVTGENASPNTGLFPFGYEFPEVVSLVKDAEAVFGK